MAIKLNYDRITPSLSKIEEGLDELPKGAYEAFKDATPIASGNAQRNTKFKKNQSLIDADYKYAHRLNDGWSKQAPKGMLPATEKYIVKQLNKIFRK
jgi:hypothetical protein